MKFRTIVLCLVVMLMGCVCAATLHAQDTGDVETPEMNLLQKGGFIGYVIIFISVIALALIIEAFWSVRRIKLAPAFIVTELDNLLNEENYDEALALCESEKCFLTNVVAAGLPKLAIDFETMQGAMGEAVSLETKKLNQKLSYISLISAVAPMLGLFGTVQGMMGCFDKIAKIANPKPSELAFNINVALATTLFGLCVAIPCMAVYAFLKNRVANISNEVTQLAGELVERFRPASTAA